MANSEDWGPGLPGREASWDLTGTGQTREAWAELRGQLVPIGAESTGSTLGSLRVNVCVCVLGRFSLASEELRRSVGSISKT